MFRHSLSKLVRTASAEARGFAKAAKAAKPAEAKVEVPLKQFGVDGRYAEALYVAATKTGKAAKIEGDLEKAVELLYANDKVTQVVEDPTIPRAKKEAFMKTLFTKAKFDDMTVNLFGVLAKNGRLGFAEKTSVAYKKIMMASRNEVDCKVTTAVPLTAAEKNDAKARCAKELPKGAIINLSAVVDKSIGGGWMLEIGDKFLDFTERTRKAKIDSVIAKCLDQGPRLIV